MCSCLTAFGSWENSMSIYPFQYKRSRSNCFHFAIDVIQCKWKQGISALSFPVKRVSVSFHLVLWSLIQGVDIVTSRASWASAPSASRLFVLCLHSSLFLLCILLHVCILQNYLSAFVRVCSSLKPPVSNPYCCPQYSLDIFQLSNPVDWVLANSKWDKGKTMTIFVKYWNCIKVAWLSCNLNIFLSI